MREPPRIEVLLTSLRAEGTPRLTLALCRIWREAGLNVGITVLFPEPRDLMPDFEAGDVPLRFLHLPQGLIARWLWLARAMCRLRKMHPGAALISMPFGWHAFAFIGARLAGGGASIVHVGNAPTLAAQSRRRRFAFRCLAMLGRPFTGHYVCCSKHVATGIRDAFRLRGPAVSVVPNGVSVRPLSARTTPASGTLRIGMVATLEAHKDHATLLKAMPAIKADLAGSGLTPRLILAGSGSLEANLRRLTCDLGLAGDVDFQGTVRDVGALLDGLHVFVFSTTEAEGQGIALLEAMAAGVPIVASDVGACREVLDHGRAGLLCTPGDAAALAEAVMALLASPEATQARRAFAQAKVQRDYNVELTAEAYARLAFGDHCA